ncbi:MAG: BirA family transcriptional regulator [Thermoleophilaceae bacterium]|jgi:BirA family biotin operon repressor/biotin-[acetyl-CoA-carboxylase] ligase|nr:BirA family transcriptional regulator [Thermoleophilaceae bacterium]
MIGSPRVHLRLADSTNERARALAAAGAPHGTLVTADEQRAGRGRQGRSWTAPPRSAVLMSVVLRDLRETLPLAAAVAVCEALPLDAAIKWPNDVWIGGRKVAGILVEARPQEGWAVLGIGLNVSTREFPPPLDATATSLAREGVSISTEDALAALLAALEGWLERPMREVLAAWRERDALHGRTVRWANGSKEGTAAGVDAAGALIVDTPEGTVTLDAGEVHLQR